jgi:ankyrin repeat protein
MCLYPSTNTPNPLLTCFLSLRVVFAASVSSQDKATPLHVAATLGNAKVAKVLLAAGANVHDTDDVSEEGWEQGGSLT